MSQSSTSPIIPIIAIIGSITIGAALAYAGSAAGTTTLGIPTFALLTALAFLIQWIAFIPAYIKRTEHFYDLVGAATYLTLILLATLLAPSLDTRALLLIGCGSLWALRIGSFLFLRVRNAGSDRRFDQLKHSFWSFLMAWTMQGLWVTFTLMALLAVLTSGRSLPLNWIGIVGFTIWGIGFLIEVVADEQKRRHRLNPANKDQFIRSGLWSLSRHPNYCGEIILWAGIAIVAYPLLIGWQHLTLLSPLFIYILLRAISGVPILERIADAKWGGEPDYEAYKAKTPVLFW